MRFALPIASVVLAASALAAEPKAVPVVRHEPARPVPGEVVLVTAKLPPDTAKATLKLQAVEPGKYIALADPAYEAEWTELPLHDDGRDGDAKAGDGVFSARVPAEYQKHRRLVRYRVVPTDRGGNTTRWPADDACPNSAWWCDAGPAAWTGSRDPGKSPAVAYSAAFLGTLQSLHLIAKAGDVARSQWDDKFHKQKQAGTVVYRGVVYDHISFGNRGQGSAHISGKNKWGLKFPRGRELPLADHDGVPFPEACAGLALNPGGSTPYEPVLRGIAGLDEVLSMRAYRLAGVPSPPVAWVQWRVVDRAEEVSAKDQSAGDLWGVYVAVGDMTPAMLGGPALPDGLVVSIQSGIKHTPKGMTGAEKRWDAFLAGARSNPKEEWWRANLDLPSYFSFHALNRLLANVDLRPDGNHGYYRPPNGHWHPVPWDNDMMFVPRQHQPGHIDAIACLDHPKIAVEYRNRAREILDLFAADARPAGGQVGQLAADLGAALTPKGHPVDWPGLDAAVWNQHPRMNQKGSYFVNPARADHFGGPWTRTLATNDFAGFRKYLVDFCTDSRPVKNYAPNDGDPRGYGWGYLAGEAADDKIPRTPTATETPGAARQYRATAFASPAGRKPVALEWRVGRVGQLGRYELVAVWHAETATGTAMDVPADVFAETGEYRVRARWRDDTGRCGHWSAPVAVRVEK